MSLTGSGFNRARSGLRVVIAAAFLAAAMAAGRSDSAWGITTDPNNPSPCSNQITASLSASPPSIPLGKGTTTVTWKVQTSPTCKPSWMRLYYRDATSGVLMDTDVSDTAIGFTGSLADRPQSSGSYFIRTWINGWWIDVGYASVSVVLPAVNGKTSVNITQPNQNGLFAQAINTQNAFVRIAGTLDLDLSYMDYLCVRPGVQIVGDRTVNRRGPRLFTTSFPVELLTVGCKWGDGLVHPSDNVRISGIRLDGGESDDPFSAVGTYDADGIGIYSSQNVEIDHSEIYRWRGAAVNVHDGNGNNDPNFVGRINLDNAETVWVHDNYIHHNQHPSSNYCGETVIDGDGHAAGYGVAVSEGAYALIERNVFDWNRHSITGDGKAGTGYLAYRNLILTNGGVHFRCLDKTSGEISFGLGLLNPFVGLGYIVAADLDGDLIYHTHTIDMHAVDDCFPGDHDCGPAGEYMDIEFNTVLYTAGNGIHLRGTPKVGMVVQHNVFAHTKHDGGMLTPGAMLQNEFGLHDSDNALGLNTFNNRKTICDFDGDGIPDPFIATGVTFWYSSSAMDGRWVFVGQSPASIGEVSFGDFDGDGLCDVRARGQVFLNPNAPAVVPSWPGAVVTSPLNISTIHSAPAGPGLSTIGSSTARF
jgi:hypothetical protein